MTLYRLCRTWLVVTTLAYAILVGVSLGAFALDTDDSGMSTAAVLMGFVLVVPLLDQVLGYLSLRLDAWSKGKELNAAIVLFSLGAYFIPGWVAGFGVFRPRGVVLLFSGVLFGTLNLVALRWSKPEV